MNRNIHPNSLSEPIDFVIPWVDGNDPEWLALRNRYLGQQIENDRAPVLFDASRNRFDDWGTLRYLFRSIESCAPWVHKIHLITWGHVPQWLNITHPQLNIVRHQDYIPTRYLPTFSANTIELNLHHLESLTEKFVYFNDDMFLLRKLTPDDFFKNGLPRLHARILPANMSRKTWFAMRTANAAIVSDHFTTWQAVRNHPIAWFNPCDGIYSLVNIMLIPFGYFSMFWALHIPEAYLKSTFETVWDKEFPLLHAVCMHKFRGNLDPNIWLMQNWQLATGRFTRREFSPGKSFHITSRDISLQAADYIRKQKGKMICVNDDLYDTDKMLLDSCKADVLSALEDRFPKKCRFEL